MEIKIFKYKKDLNYIKFLKRNFDNKTEFSLIENKTIIINILIKNELVGTICLINNDDLMKFLENKNPDVINNYVFRAAKGMFIYNFTVDKKYRKHKLGYKLLNICLYIIKTLKYEYCHCHVDDKSISQKMFLKYKFTNETIIKTKNSLCVNMTYWI
jgi:hypothetical protein